jgi:hypothetical protein
VCDARALGGALTIRSDVVVDRPNVSILLGAATIQIEEAARVRIVANEFSLRGLSRRATVLKVQGPVGLEIGGEGSVTRGWQLERFTIARAGARPQASGITMRDAREGRMTDVIVTGFGDSGTGVIVGDGCWSNVADGFNASQNTRGLAFVGTNANAWTFRSCNFNLNVVGVLFALGAGTGQGIGFVDGTHFEGNSAASVLLESGNLQDVFFTDPYVEALSKERFLVAESRAAYPLRVVPLRITGGYLYANDQVPLTLTTRAGSRDRVQAVLSGVHLCSSLPALSTVLVSGAQASASVSGLTFQDTQGHDAVVESVAPSSACVSTLPGRGTLEIPCALAVGQCSERDLSSVLTPVEQWVDAVSSDPGVLASVTRRAGRPALRACRVTASQGGPTCTVRLSHSDCTTVVARRRQE